MQVCVGVCVYVCMCACVVLPHYHYVKFTVCNILCTCITVGYNDNSN